MDLFGSYGLIVIESGLGAAGGPHLRARPKTTSYFHPGFASRNYEVNNGRPLRSIYKVSLL